MSGAIRLFTLMAMLVLFIILPGIIMSRGVKRLGMSIGNRIVAFIMGCIPILNYLFLISHLASRKTVFRIKALKDATENLQNGLSDSKVNDYINLVNEDAIPNELQLWNTLRAGYTLVKSDRNVSEELKNRLRVVMLSRGVDRI